MGTYVYSIQIYKNKIYYVDPERALIRKYDVKTKKLSTVVELNSELDDIQGTMRGMYSCRMFVFKDVIYLNLLGTLYAVTTEGELIRTIDSGVDPYFFTYKNLVYYVKDGYRLKAYNTKTRKKKTVKRFKSKVWMTCVEGSSAYFMKWGEVSGSKRITHFYKLNLKNRKFTHICKSKIAYGVDSYILLGQIVKDRKMYLTTNVEDRDRFAQINKKTGSLNYNKFSKKYTFIGGYYSKIAMGYYKNSIVASEYKTRKNAEKNKIQKFIKLV